MTTGSDDFSDVVVHVGYHKAGSTLLQDHLFREDRGMWSPWPQRFYHQHILLDRPDAGWSARVRAAFGPGIDDSRARGLLPVLTCEALSGDIWRAGQSNGFGNFHVADVLADALPGARIAIVHREQGAMLASLYKHSIRSHWRYSARDFLDQSPVGRGRAPILNFGYLQYSWLLEHYVGRVGRDRVLPLPFELLRDAGEWAARWQGFLGTEVRPEWFREQTNPGIAAVTARGKRFANFAIPAGAEPNRTRIGRLVNSIAHQIDTRVPLRARHSSESLLRDEVDRAAGDYFAVDNARLAELTGEDWSRFGYRTAPEGGSLP